MFCKLCSLSKVSCHKAAGHIPAYCHQRLFGPSKTRLNEPAIRRSVFRAERSHLSLRLSPRFLAIWGFGQCEATEVHTKHVLIRTSQTYNKKVQADYSPSCRKCGETSQAGASPSCRGVPARPGAADYTTLH